MNKGNTYKLKKMATDYEVPHCMVKIIDNPTLQLKGGKFVLELCEYLSDIIEGKSSDDICSMITGNKFETVDLFKKQIKSKQRKDNKKNKKKDAQFVAKDEKGNIITLTSVYKYFCDITKQNISEEDKNNESYHKNSKFNLMVYLNSKWKDTKENKKVYKQLQKDVEKVNKKLQNKIDTLKKESGFIDKPKMPRKNAYLLYKKEKQEDFEKYYKKNKDKLTKSKMLEFTSFSSRKWKKETQETKDSFIKRDNKRYDKEMVIYKEKMTLWNKYQEKISSKKHNCSDTEDEESNDDESNDEQSNNQSSSNDDSNEESEEEDNDNSNSDESDSDSD